MADTPTPQCDGVASHLTVSTTHRGMGTRTIDNWPLGDGAGLMRLRYRALAVSNAHHVKTDPNHRLISMAVLAPGDWTLTRPRTDVPHRADRPTLVIIDQSDPFDFRGHGSGSATVLYTTYPRLTLSVETVHRGLHQLNPDLPLYPLMLNHLLQLGVIATTAGNVLPDLAASTVSLMRSLLLSAADGSPTPDPTDTLVQEITRYIHEHLYAPELSADSIAAAHSISARQLYKIWPATNGPLAGYIIGCRLEQACRTLLAEPGLSIAAIAQKHGFTQTTHFSHRFRRTYGVSPTQWRQQRLATSSIEHRCST
ncbi:AraC family transcriptional regulator [Williamsia sp. D3]|uniref:helix-turn-helix transcriptional regulator n=1 Tax=Williamsia sp. D3 TaxID=1313067 RepID=UPI0003D3103D|nr:AraC family transcriptional regulator [Williamsia sp. D3]ETD32498.1 hypothetical protein W823_13340 [Williamsia sp. D3]